MRYWSVCVEAEQQRSLQDRWRNRSAHLLLKYSLIFGHTDKSNTSFESVKTPCLFVCTHNNNKTLCFCKIMKANRMRFLPSRSLWTWARNCVYLCLTYIKNISIESEMSTFKWTNSNGKQIFSDYVICMKHAYIRITTAEMTSQCCRLHLLNRKQRKHSLSINY